MRDAIRRLVSPENISASVVVIVSLLLAALNLFSPLGQDLLFTAVLFSLGILGASLVLERLTYLHRIEEKVSNLTTAVPPGYVRVYKTRDELPGYGPYIQPARHEILAIGLDLDTTIRRYRQAIRIKLEAEKNCRVLLLVMNPEVNGQMNPMVRRTSQWIHENPDMLQRRIRDNLATLESFKNDLPDHARERVEVKVYDGVGTIFLAIDGEHSHGKILIGLYPYGVESNNLWPLIEFQADKQDTGIYRTLYERYKRMFMESKPWSVR